MTAVASNLFTVDSNKGWYSVNTGKIKNPKEREEVANKCIYDARMERLKSASFVVLSGAAALGENLVVLAVALVAFHVASCVIPVFAFPVAFSASLYEMVVSLGELGLGLGLFGLFLGNCGTFFDKTGFSKKSYNEAKAHWDYSNHLYAQHQLVLQKA